MRTLILLAITSVILSACTTGSGKRTSRRLYQPTHSSDVEILFREPTRPFTVVGPVSSFGAPIAAENAMYRAVQKEAAELGADAVIVEGPGIGRNYNGFRRGKPLQALAGLQAQRRVDPQSMRRRDANGDEAIAEDLLLRLHREERERNCAFKYLEARARNLVSHHWRTVEELAEVMLNYQSIAGREVANILRASRLAQMHEDPAP